MTAANVVTGPDLTFRFVQRRLAQALHQRPQNDAASGPTLEAQRITTGEPPRLAQAAVLEGSSVRRRAVPGNPGVGFAAFLDGIQASRPMIYDATVPIVHGYIGAAIRIRDDRRL